MKRRLSLKSEYVSDLSSTELASVAGGVSGGCMTGVYPTFDRPCLSADVCLAHDPVPTLARCFTGTPAPTLFC